MSRTDAFFDTNVLLYLAGSDGAKAARSEELVAAEGVVSVQVLNEFVSVSRRKTPRTWRQISEMLAGVRANCRVVALSLETHERGFAYAERYRLSVFDAMIVASAVLAGCTTLYSEDMHDGLVIDGLTVRNPYLS